MSIRYRKDRDKWEVSICIHGKRRAKLFRTKKEAEAFNKDAQLQTVGLKGIEQPYSIQAAFVNWLETESVRKAEQSQAADRRFFEIARYYFEEMRGRKLMSEVGLDDLQRFQIWAANAHDCEPIAVAKEAWSQTTFARHAALLKSVFRKAFNIQRIQSNPAEFWRVHAGEGQKREPMTREDFERMYLFSPAWFQPVLAFMRLTGARGASIAELTWSDVDFFGAVVYLTSRKGAAGRAKRIKIPIYEELARLLATIRNSAPSILETMQGSNKVFLDEKNVPVTAAKIATTGHRMIKKAGLKGVVLYGLRHAIATEMTEAGIPTDIIRKAMGHDSIRTTQHYAEGAGISAVGEAFKQIRGSDSTESLQPITTIAEIVEKKGEGKW
jgi:integrase